MPVTSGVEPVIYFKVVDETGLLANTKRDLRWTPKSGPDPVIIRLRDGRGAQDELLEKLPPTLREEIESLRKYDVRLLEEAEHRYGAKILGAGVGPTDVKVPII